MTKSDLINIFNGESNSKPTKKIYETNKKFYNHLDETWSFDLADMIDYKISNNKKFGYIFVIFDNFSKYTRCIPVKNKYGETITKEISIILTKSKQSPLKLESDRGKEWYNSIFQNFLKVKNIHHYSRFSDKSPSVCERVIRTVRNLLRKTNFLAGNADWISGLPTVIKKYRNTIHNSTKRTPIQASKKVNEKFVSSNLEGRRVKQQPKYKLGQLVRLADIKRIFSKKDSTNYSSELYTITEVFMMLYHPVESTIYLREILKIY